MEQQLRQLQLMGDVVLLRPAPAVAMETCCTSHVCVAWWTSVGHGAREGGPATNLRDVGYLVRQSSTNQHSATLIRHRFVAMNLVCTSITSTDSPWTWLSWCCYVMSIAIIGAFAPISTQLHAQVLATTKALNVCFSHTRNQELLRTWQSFDRFGVATYYAHALHRQSPLHVAKWRCDSCESRTNDDFVDRCAVLAREWRMSRIRASSSS